MLPTKREMRVRFHQLREEVAKIEAEQVKPLRDKYDKLWQDCHAKSKPLIDKIKEIEKPLFDKKNEMGTLCRALGNQTSLDLGDN